MKVLKGTAQGFLSIKNDESGKLTWLPIAPFAGAGSLLAQSDDGGVSAEENNPRAHFRRGGPMLEEEESSLPLQGGSGGYAYFSNGVYDNKYSLYTYNVDSAPPNMCGGLYIIRNGNSEWTPNWICTDSSGHAQKGPWYGSTNQTGQFITIYWPNGTHTVGGDYKVDDGSEPNVWPNQTPGFGVPIPNSFDGTATDAQWGSGFSWWTRIYARYIDVTTSKYYDGQGYNSVSPVEIDGTFSPPTAFTISWSVPSPPPSIHSSTHTYEWCVYGNDYPYPAFACLYFYGPR
jgi:hypothetical protein